MLKKAEEAIILTHETLLKKANMQGLSLVMQGFSSFGFGSRDLWNKLTSIFEKELAKPREPIEGN